MNPRIESLEPRTLLSQTWQTADSFQLADGQPADVRDMAADAAGNVYAAGRARDAAGISHYVIRMESPGSDVWTTIYQETGSGGLNVQLAATPGGDLYLRTQEAPGSIRKMTRSAGETSFQTVQTFPSGSGVRDLEVDAAGNVYAVGSSQQQIGVNKKNQPVYGSFWTVWKQTGGAGPFVKADAFLTNGGEALDVGVVRDGPAAGVYVVGRGATDSWNVRRSADAGNTWTTLDNFQYQPTQPGASPATEEVYSIAGDGAGNLYAAGLVSWTWSTGTYHGKPTYDSTSAFAIRKGTLASDGSLSWSTDYLQEWPSTWGGGFSSVSLAIDGANQAYFGVTSVVLSNAGGSWTVVDDFRISPYPNATVTSMATDASGRVFVGGDARDAAGVSHWLVRSPAAVPATTAAGTFSTTTIGDNPASINDPTLAEQLLGAGQAT